MLQNLASASLSKEAVFLAASGCAAGPLQEPCFRHPGRVEPPKARWKLQGQHGAGFTSL